MQKKPKNLWRIENIFILPPDAGKGPPAEKGYFPEMVIIKLDKKIDFTINNPLWGWTKEGLNSKDQGCYSMVFLLALPFCILSNLIYL